MYEEDKSVEWLMISKIDVDALEKCVKTKKINGYSAELWLEFLFMTKFLWIGRRCRL